MKIVLDTNCLLLALSKHADEYLIWRFFLDEKIILCVTSDIINEYHEIIARLTNEKLADNVIHTILTKKNIQKVNVFYRFNLITSDPDDNKFVDCAIISNAKYIVSNDKHFRELKKIAFPKVSVITAIDFIKKLKNK